MTDIVDGLSFKVDSEDLPVSLERKLLFKDNQLSWQFRVENKGEADLSYQYIMHPLMPLDDMKQLDLPACDVAWDNDTKEDLPLKNADEIAAFLLDTAKGDSLIARLTALAAG